MFEERPIGRKVASYFEIAYKVASNRGRFRKTFFLGAIGIRSDGVMVHADNGFSMQVERKGHAEYRVAQKLTPYSEVYVCRISRLTGEFANAKPCNSCQKMLRSKGVRKVYYTMGPKEYGVMQL